MKRDRREFLKGATLATAASATATLTACTTENEPPKTSESRYASQSPIT